jgi:hypothetical protein
MTSVGDRMQAFTTGRSQGADGRAVGTAKKVVGIGCFDVDRRHLADCMDGVGTLENRRHRHAIDIGKYFFI